MMQRMAAARVPRHNIVRGRQRRGAGGTGRRRGRASRGRPAPAALFQLRQHWLGHRSRPQGARPLLCAARSVPLRVLPRDGQWRARPPRRVAEALQLFGLLQDHVGLSALPLYEQHQHSLLQSTASLWQHTSNHGQGWPGRQAWWSMTHVFCVSLSIVFPFIESYQVKKVFYFVFLNQIGDDAIYNTFAP
jgi:hypothetical protein